MRDQIPVLTVKSCERCGAVVKIGDVDNEAAHYGWHDTQDELLRLLTEGAQSYANFARSVGGGNYPCLT